MRITRIQIPQFRIELFVSDKLAVPRLENVQLRFHFLRRGTMGVLVMKRLAYLLIVIWTLLGVQITFGQRISWERTYDHSTGVNGQGDNILAVFLQDTSQFFIQTVTNEFSIRLSNGRRQKPVFFKVNSSGIILDTLIINDSISGYQASLNRARNHFWLYYNVQNFPYN